MTSEEMNAAIREIEKDDSVAFEAFGGKPVPFIGWFWRTVDFDRLGRQTFGVIPAGTLDGDDQNDKPLVGFMQNNKWDYPEIQPTEQEWADTRAAVEKALTSRAVDDFRAANDLIQSFASKPWIVCEEVG